MQAGDEYTEHWRAAMVLAGNNTPQNKSQRTELNGWHESAAELIAANKETLAGRIMALHFERNPALAERYGERERAFYLRDTVYTLESLAAALKLHEPGVFADYMAWVKRLFEARGIPIAGLPLHLECVGAALREALPGDVGERVDEYVAMGAQAFDGRAEGSRAASEAS
jgi:MerR family transcriptional regulator, light-induced transcriptional regulator